jgi:hypothetical protein
MGVAMTALREPDPDAIRAHAERLAEEIDDLADRWNATEEADADLGAEVQDKGEQLMLLAGHLAGATGAPQAAELHGLAARLSDAVDYYGDLDEHDTNASIGISDQLGPGVSLVRQIALLTEAAANRVATGGNDSIEAAVWSITYSNGYVRGLAEGRGGAGGHCPADAAEGYRVGYARGYRWGTTHPAP